MSENLTWILCKYKNEKNCTRAFQDLSELRIHEVNVHQEHGCGKSSGPKLSNLVIELEEFKIQLERYDEKYPRKNLTVFSTSESLKIQSPKVRQKTSSANPGPARFTRQINRSNSYSSKAEKKRHEESHFIQEKKVLLPTLPCRFCEKKLSGKYNLEIHERRHTGEMPFKCSQCDNAYPSKCEKERHERTHFIKDNRYRVSFQCQLCDMKWKSKEMLTAHERSHDFDKFRITNSTGNQDERKYLNDIKAGIQCCKFCDKKFPTKYKLMIHERGHTGEKPFACSYCDKSYTNKAHKNRHEEIHLSQDNKVIWQCQFCEKKLGGKYELDIHERRHTGEKPFNCSHNCGKAFASIKNKNRHEKTHFKQKEDYNYNYQCRFCGAKLSTYQTLTDHERSHMGEKPCVCNFCGKAFVSNSLKNRHEKTHLSDSGISPNIFHVNEEIITGDIMELDPLDTTDLSGGNLSEILVQTVPNDISMINSIDNHLPFISEGVNESNDIVNEVFQPIELEPKCSVNIIKVELLNNLEIPESPEFTTALLGSELCKESPTDITITVKYEN